MNQSFYSSKQNFYFHKNSYKFIIKGYDQFIDLYPFNSFLYFEDKQTFVTSDNNGIYLWNISSLMQENYNDNKIYFTNKEICGYSHSFEKINEDKIIGSSCDCNYLRIFQCLN